MFTAGDSTADSTAQIADYQALDDVVTLASSSVAADSSIDVATTTTGSLARLYYAEAAAIFTDASGPVTIQVKDGVMTLLGSSSDTSLANSLDEWITLARTALADGTANSLVFRYGANAYLIEDDGSENLPPLNTGTLVSLGATVNLIQLNGLTAVSALSDNGIASSGTVLIT